MGLTAIYKSRELSAWGRRTVPAPQGHMEAAFRDRVKN